MKMKEKEIRKEPERKIQSESDSPSLSMSDCDEMVLKNKTSNRSIGSGITRKSNQDRNGRGKLSESDNKTKQILNKFINAYEQKGNVKIWLIAFKGMKPDQLSIIKRDKKFLRYLDRLKLKDDYRQFVTDILRKCRSS